MAPNPSPPLNLNIPASSATVSVKIINTTSYISNIPLDDFIAPLTPHFTTFEHCPAYSFLIEHGSTKILFDLGIRKDFLNLFPPLVERLTKGGWKVEVEKNVIDILQEQGIRGEEIKSIIWSHWHWDHTGDMSTFPSSTELIVGPGFTKAFVPGYPTNPEVPVLESDLADRELREITFGDDGLKIGNFEAHDFFGDGSFYLLDTPGHAIGHLCGLARVKLEGEGGGGAHFILMGGDACHHGGEFRPSKYIPFPDSITPHPFHSLKSTEAPNPCPGAVFEKLLRDGDATKPFYAVPADSKIHYDREQCEASIQKVMEADGNLNVFTVMAHDKSLLDVVDFFPESANEFKEKGWVEAGRWGFLKDFELAAKEL